MKRNEKKTYKGVGIYYNIYGTEEYAVNIDGKDYLFDTEAAAKEAIDDILD